MTAYPDASLLVASLSNERMTETAINWFSGHAPGALLSSRWCLTETASALAIKVRTGVLAADRYDEVVNAAHLLLRQASSDVPIRSSHFDAATALVRRSRKPLRGGDALHLAIAAGVGVTLWTLDRKMAEAGQALALDVRLLA